MWEKSFNHENENEMEVLTARWQEVTRRVADAADGRDVRILAATKTVSPERINYAIDHLGLTLIGENRVQELLSKYDALHKENVEIHFIGRLQTNKVKYIVDKVDMIESVDSLRLAEEISNRAMKIGKVMDILVEVNIGREESKGGILPEELDAFLDAILPLGGIRFAGIMVIPPKIAENDRPEKYFSESFQIFLDIQQKKHHNIREPLLLSMGMSDSFETAIRCGSGQVRLGSAIFGHRNYP
ncbi:MAG: YggS family pyridoxal phosphate-dependent enzyme [Eubacteriales bacterium]